MKGLKEVLSVSFTTVGPLLDSLEQLHDHVAMLCYYTGYEVHCDNLSHKLKTFTFSSKFVSAATETDQKKMMGQSSTAAKLSAA